ADAHAYFDPNVNVLYLRRDDLQRDTKLAAIEIAHEGTHLLDHVGKVNDAFTKPREATFAGLGAAQAKAARDQLSFESMMVAESRAFVYAGQVARDIGWTGVAADPTSIASAGGNDAATYAKVWQQLLTGPYNNEHRTAATVMV
ncbi:MAG: hypothetical protein H7123_07850, partial [Thermoleophilia bacterium]|nr:hypothetical protein [Thermoleophilia bacterium]